MCSWDKFDVGNRFENSENGMRHKNVRSGRTYYKGFFLVVQGYPENLRKDLVVVSRKTR